MRSQEYKPASYDEHLTALNWLEPDHDTIDFRDRPTNFEQAGSDCTAFGREPNGETRATSTSVLRSRPGRASICGTSCRADRKRFARKAIARATLKHSRRLARAYRNRGIWLTCAICPLFNGYARKAAPPCRWPCQTKARQCRIHRSRD